MSNRGRHKKIKIIDVVIKDTPIKYVKYIWYKNENNDILLKIHEYLK